MWSITYWLINLVNRLNYSYLHVTYVTIDWTFIIDLPIILIKENFSRSIPNIALLWISQKKKKTSEERTCGKTLRAVRKLRVLSRNKRNVEAKVRRETCSLRIANYIGASNVTASRKTGTTISRKCSSEIAGKKRHRGLSYRPLPVSPSSPRRQNNIDCSSFRGIDVRAEIPLTPLLFFLPPPPLPLPLALVSSWHLLTRSITSLLSLSSVKFDGTAVTNSFR